MGLFSSVPHHDDVLGEFTRESGWWRGQIDLPPHGVVALRLAGGRSAPDAASVAAARSLAAVYARLSGEVGAVLYEHYLPGLEAWRAGELAGLVDRYPELTRAEEVWNHVRVERVDVDASGREYAIEVRFETAWDEEHTLGVRIRGESLVGLCGSAGP